MRAGRHLLSWAGSAQSPWSCRRWLAQSRRRKVIWRRSLQRFRSDARGLRPHWGQSSTRIPKPVSLGIPSLISTKPRSISAAELFSLTGNIFCLPLRSQAEADRRVKGSADLTALPGRLDTNGWGLNCGCGAASTAGCSPLGWSRSRWIEIRRGSRNIPQGRHPVWANRA